jgi:methylmalonyl-CoA/ethylmalonyl-CoA epimerase
MMNFRPFLHHVGIVQPHESEALEQMSLLGLAEEYRGFVPQWSALCIFTKARHGSQIEFVIPNGGPLAGFNKGVGGLHHIAFEVCDLDEVALALHAQGMKFLEVEHARGAGPFICNFLSPGFTRGLTVEYVQLINIAASQTT